MIVMGLDQSYTKSGIVILEKGNPNMIHYEKYSSDTNKDIFERAWDISQHICELVKIHHVEKVYIEGLAFGSRGNATRDLGGLQFTVVTQLRFAGLQVPVEIIAPTTLKKYATGNGGKTTKKEDMINALPPHIKNKFLVDLGVKKTTGLDDMADAFWLADLGVK